MKVTTSATMAVLLVLMGAATCTAADATSRDAEIKDSAATKQYTVDVSKVRRNQKLRAWVDTIKPAAGHVEPAAHPPANEYWRQSVRRENRGSMHE